MNLFTNALEKKQMDCTIKASLTIEEHEGMYQIIWSEPAILSRWFIGSNWEEMLHAFRVGLQDKMKDGFLPVYRGESQ